jgi:hypothetical protein
MEFKLTSEFLELISFDWKILEKYRLGKKKNEKL